ncbi:MAG: hypothetical protein JW709_09035, partial [Sedimentisphaerales bacterium]|nr:hypothetical protein [Sedimentisphaerales bacterium]
MNIKKSLSLIPLVLATSVWLVGCQPTPRVGSRALRQEFTDDHRRVLVFDTDNDHRADYWQIFNAGGRKTELIFAPAKEKQELSENTSATASTEISVRLDTVSALAAPHFIIALDGVPYSLVEELYEQGHFRLFHPPVKMISTFPAMTDLAFQRIFGGRQPIAYQAEHFDRDLNRMRNGNDIYLSGEAADWANRLDYRIGFLWDAMAYTFPQQVFDQEKQGMMDVLRRTEDARTAIVYSVGTAGLGTQGGREAILGYLRDIDMMCEQLVFERRGRVKITLLADHGHNMSGRGRISFDDDLRQAGYRPFDKLEKPGDVVAIKYGLVTYAAFFTDDASGVADVLIHNPAVTLACYPQGDDVVVKTLTGSARIDKQDERFRYTCLSDDPLNLKPLITQLTDQGYVDQDGFIDDHAFLVASADHEYPDALRRVWEAFHGLVKKPADLIVCLEDGWVHGSSFF